MAKLSGQISQRDFGNDVALAEMQRDAIELATNKTDLMLATYEEKEAIRKSVWAPEYQISATPTYKIAKALVLQRIRDDKGAVAQDGVAAKRDVARRLAQLHARAGFEPLAVFVHQADQRNVHPEQALGHAREAVKPLLGDGVQHIE